jgi:hypothetical protein
LPCETEDLLADAGIGHDALIEFIELSISSSAFTRREPKFKQIAAVLGGVHTMKLEIN